VKKLAEDYGLPLLRGATPDWPAGVTRDLVVKATVEHLCIDLKGHIPSPLEPEAISASPGDYIPVLKRVLDEYETMHRPNANNGSEPLPKLFGIYPQVSVHWRFISLDARALASFVNINRPHQLSEYPQLFHQVFDLTFTRQKVSHFILQSAMPELRYTLSKRREFLV
jgi:hypothetical protein